MARFVPAGTHTALVTPFLDDDDRSLDLPALRGLVEMQIAGGVDGLVACGTTGETATLTDDEYQTVVATVVAAANGRVPVLAGVGSNSTAKTLLTTHTACALGVDGVLVVTPYYNKPTQAGMKEHFLRVADAATVPVVLYNVPGRTGVNLLPATVAELARHPNVVALKEAAGSLEQVQETVRLTEFAFAVLSGEDALCVPTYAVGGRGVISVVSNVAPARTAALWRDFSAGRTEAAARGQVDLLPLIKALFCEPNPQPAKMAMHLLGHMAPACRLPLVAASDATRTALQAELRRLALLG
ncbi:MAG: 4-hydroxy-tetrahydrodipicolinate synthase [Deltaproteobacteria bacterium]|nr:4-hydroxy-tetrahydrodipicolinate synthase [Deltaproteobacteria bacterium]